MIIILPYYAEFKGSHTTGSVLQSLETLFVALVIVQIHFWEIVVGESRTVVLWCLGWEEL